MEGMGTPRIVLLVGAVLVAEACGSVTSAPDAGTGGTNSSAGTGGVAGTTAGGTGGGGGTSAGGMSGGGGGGLGGLGGLPDGGVLTCHVDLNDCPNGYTCACGGAGVGMCTCHKNCTDVNQCGTAEPMCGCPSTTGSARFCVNACFCNCR